jgi:hypothetical protein
LAETQHQISSTFASKKTIDKFADLAIEERERTSPVLHGVLAWLDCDVHQRIDAGDHIVLIGRVIDHGHSECTPLGFFSGNYVDFSLARRAVEAANDHASTVAGIFEWNGQILLLKQGSHWGLPMGSTLGEGTYEAGSLFDVLRRHGINASVTFVFSIAHEETTGRTSIYYRGEISSPAPQENSTVRLARIDELPWDEMQPGYRGMLERYMRERSEARFGIYVGTTRAGRVKNLEP